MKEKYPSLEKRLSILPFLPANVRSFVIENEILKVDPMEWGQRVKSCEYQINIQLYIIELVIPIHFSEKTGKFQWDRTGKSLGFYGGMYLN